MPQITVFYFILKLFFSHLKVQGGFVAAQPNVYQPVGTTNHQPPPAYQVD